MSLPTLQYIEIQKRARKLPITFRKICPESSGTIEDQTTEKKGMSIVAFFSPKDKEQITINVVNKIDDLHYGFIPTNNLHSTLLTIYPSKHVFLEKSNTYFNDLIKGELNTFFSKTENSNKFTLKFHEFRPGTWYDLDNNPIPNASNGTVVAIGNPDENGYKKFVDIANKLVCDLRNNLGQIFGDKFDRKYSTVWSTLGYFNNSDFDITEKFKDTFNQLNITISIKIESLWLVEYSFKDLRDEHKNNLLEFPLL